MKQIFVAQSVMEFRLILFSLFLKMIYICYGEHVSSPVINMNGCCSNQLMSGNCEEQSQKLLTNVTKLLDEHEKRIKEILETHESSFKSRDCQDILRLGHRTTGIYTIYPEGTLGFPVRCDMDTTNGGWTVIQRRVSDSDFYKTWKEYQIGFGNLSENFWIGNQQIHVISSQGWYELRVNLVSLDGEAAHAAYNVFLVGDIDSGYKLTVDGYSGNAGDSLAHHNGRKFSTKDKDNDDHSSNCAQTYTGAWWYGTCHNANLNGKFGATANKGPRWSAFRGADPMQKTEMMIRRWRPSSTDSV